MILSIVRATEHLRNPWTVLQLNPCNQKRAILFRAQILHIVPKASFNAFAA
jgi:hypothetical protein